MVLREPARLSAIALAQAEALESARMALRILFAGSGEFGAPSLSALMEAGHEIAAVISQPDRPAGRGGGLTPTPIARLAIERGLRGVRTGDIKQEKIDAGGLVGGVWVRQKNAA